MTEQQSLPPLTETPEWSALMNHRAQLEGLPLKDLFQQDAQRYPRMTLEAAGLTLDYSRNRVTDQTLGLLADLARGRGLPERVNALFRGEQLNTTEKRPALHTALRQPQDQPVQVDGENIMPAIQATLERMEVFTNAVRGGEWRGMNGDTITDVVSIGIGGSYLGPLTATEALTPFQSEHPRCHYVANVDGSDIREALAGLNPATTLFLVQSKSFTTQETLANARVARQWFLDGGGTETTVQHHFAAVTANADRARDFGIAGDSIFPMWDWVGGRYSLWSAIGLPVALAVGMPRFRELLAGAHAMDQHFQQAPPEQNMPMLMGLMGLWYMHGFGAESQAVIPYDHYLRHLPEHLQQLDMESNGKSVCLDGSPVSHHTGPVIWGGPGVNGQHAYHQLLHQGTRLVPVDFILPLTSHNPVDGHHAMLAANCLAQARALMLGRTEQEVRAVMIAEGMAEDEAQRLAPHRAIPGNRPSNLLTMERLEPATLGALIALYEHRTFVQAAIWRINPFDQWGVELGKEIGGQILPALNGEPETDMTFDSATAGQIARFRAAQGSGSGSR
ncbi:glucose-6-phosphate isomerase [Halospina sp. K52047b]|uniref:glucose-6-phosphate isomerase n=1 Tax=Halospina sp. K52047b TaxID=2614160 RepID=UPI001CE3C998|nr:glucose-6-phosphate isomerase [Halospina sp. K52047b]